MWNSETTSWWGIYKAYFGTKVAFITWEVALYFQIKKVVDSPTNKHEKKDDKVMALKTS